MELRTMYLESKEKDRQKDGLSILLSVHHWCITEDKSQADFCISGEFQAGNLLKIKKEGKKGTIHYGEPVHFFRGVSLLLQNMEKECWEKEEIPVFDSNGMMLDCSRNGVPTVETIQKYLVSLAEFGMNRLYLYMEDTFEVEGYPYWGYLRGRYTKQELKLCDAFAGKFGITLVPCIQTLAHLRSVLKQPTMKQYQDIDDILLLGTQESKELLREILHTVKECFSGGMVHLGMDEAAHLGRGRYLEKNGWKNPAIIMKEHLEWLMKECKKLELTPMIWSDMYLRLNFGVENYYGLKGDEEPLHTETLSSEIPLCYWDYYNEGIDFYETYIRLHQKLGNPVVFAGGAWTWNGIAPGLSKAFRTTQDALAACQHTGIRDVFCTAWMDNGAETPLETTLPLMAIYGEYGFSVMPDQEQIKERFSFCFGQSWESFCLLDAFDNQSYCQKEVDKIFQLVTHNKRCENPSKTILYEDNFMGKMADLFDENHMKEQYKWLEDQLKNIPGKLFAYYRILAALLQKKAGLNERIRIAYRKDDRKTLLEISQKELKEMENLSEELRLLRQEIWMKEYKPFGYEILDIRLGGVGIRARSEAARLQAYAEGKLEHIEELEETLLPYLSQEPLEKEALRRCSLWEEIVSAGNMEGV